MEKKKGRKGQRELDGTEKGRREKRKKELLTSHKKSSTVVARKISTRSRRHGSRHDLPSHSESVCVATEHRPSRSPIASRSSSSSHALHRRLDLTDLDSLLMTCRALEDLVGNGVELIVVAVVVELDVGSHVLNGDGGTSFLNIRYDGGLLSTTRSLESQSFEGSGEVGGEGVGVGRVFEDGFPAFRWGARRGDEKVFGDGRRFEVVGRGFEDGGSSGVESEGESGEEEEKRKGKRGRKVSEASSNADFRARTKEAQEECSPRLLLHSILSL